MLQQDIVMIMDRCAPELLDVGHVLKALLQAEDMAAELHCHDI